MDRVVITTKGDLVFKIFPCKDFPQGVVISYIDDDDDFYLKLSKEQAIELAEAILSQAKEIQ